MAKKISYRGFVKINNYDVDSEYAVFSCDMGNLHPVIYRGGNDNFTWKLDCDVLNIHGVNMCPAHRCDSWKIAIDFAIVELHNRVKGLYDSTALMMLNGTPGHDTGVKNNKFNVYKHGELGNAPCCEAKFDKYHVQVYQDDAVYGDKAPWYMVCNDVGISRGYQIGLCRDAECAMKAAISIIKNKIDNMHTIACSLEV